MAITIGDGVYTVLSRDEQGRPLRFDHPDGVQEIVEWADNTPRAWSCITPSQAYLDAHPTPEPPPPPPDAGGYMLAVYAEPPVGLGEERAQLIGRDWPQGVIALQRGNYELARAVLDKMLANTNPTFTTITEAEHATMLALMDTFHIPGATPNP